MKHNTAWHVAQQKCASLQKPSFLQQTHFIWALALLLVDVIWLIKCNSVSQIRFAFVVLGFVPVDRLWTPNAWNIMISWLSNLIIQKISILFVWIHLFPQNETIVDWYTRIQFSNLSMSFYTPCCCKLYGINTQLTKSTLPIATL